MIFGSVFPRFINILLTEINIEIIYLKKLCHDCSDAVVGRLSIVLLLRPKSKIGSIEVGIQQLNIQSPAKKCRRYIFKFEY